MKAIIKLDIPDYQIGQEVSIYFKDTMMIKGVVEKEILCEDAVSRQSVFDREEITDWSGAQGNTINREKEENERGHWGIYG